jgi:O-antigen ligase
VVIVEEPLTHAPRAPARRLLGAALLSSPSLLPCVVAVAVLIGFAGYQAGYPTTVWYPGGLLLAAALAAALVATKRPFAGLPRAALGALLCLVGFAAWSYLSIVWADQQGDAWDGANKTLLYLCVFALFALWPVRPGAAMLLMGGYAIGVAGVMAAYLARAAGSGDPAEFLIGGRLSEPAGYPNAACALALGGFWLATFLASRRETPWVARPLLLAAAGVTLEAAVLAQSRGSIVAVPLTMLLSLAIVRGRARLLTTYVIVGAVAFLLRGPLLDVYPARFDEPALEAALDDVLRTVAVSAAVLGGIGLVLALIDRRLDVSERLRQLTARAVGAIAAVAAVAAIAALLVVHGNPVTKIENAWDDFTAVHGTGTYLTEEGSRFSGGLGSNRWDFWTVAVDQFQRSPLTGAGADNFLLDYLEQRRSFEGPRYAHSLELRILGGLGIVGALLFVGFLGFALAAAHRARASTDRLAAALAATGVVAFGYWAIHGSIDWLWEFPGLSGPAFAWLGLAIGQRPLSRTRPPDEAAADGSRPRALARLTAPLGLAAVTLATVATLVPPWLAAREVDVAAATWRENPDAAFDRLERARALNRLAERADLTAGTIASRLEDWDRMELWFGRALERSPRNYYAQLQLAVAASHQGRFDEAQARLGEAQRLNPADPTIDLALEHAERREPIPQETLLRDWLDRVEQVTS